MSITSGLSPIRRYANGGDVNTERQNMLAKLGFPSGITNEQLDAAIAKQKGAAYLPESQAPGTTVGQLPGLFKENVFDPTDPVDYATLPFLSLKAAKLLGKAGKKVYDTVRGSGGKVRENLRGIGAYVGADMLADEIRDDSDPFFTKQDDGTYVSTSPTEEKGLEDDALDEATKDVADVNAEEEKKEKEKTLKDYIDDLGTFQSMMTPGQMTGGTFIKASGISTPEIRRYQNGGITNMMPVSMAEGGGIDFAKLGSDLGGMPDTPTMSTGSAIAPATINTPEIKQGNPEALKDAEEDFDKFKADVKSNYVNFASGGIANMDPMMMAGGGIANYSNEIPGYFLGGLAKIGKGVLKGGTDFYKKITKKEAKQKGADVDKKKPDTKKKETKTEKAKRILPPEVGALATPIIGAGKLTKEAIRKLGGEGGLGRGVARTAAYGIPLGYGVDALFGKDETPKPPTKSTDATVPEIEESNAMKDILYQNSLERATSAGRTEPVFMDYLASFPGSYTEKVGKDPEFARQMMAGFMAMMKPTEGYVPRNALVDFGEAAYGEQARQEGEVPDQIKLMKEFQNNPELADAYKKFLKSQEAYDPIQEQKARARIFLDLQEMIFGEGFDEDDIPTNIATKQPADPFTVYNEFLSLGGDQDALFALKDKYSME